MKPQLQFSSFSHSVANRRTRAAGHGHCFPIPQSLPRAELKGCYFRSVFSSFFQKGSAVSSRPGSGRKDLSDCPGHCFPTSYVRSLICPCCWWLGITALVLPWAFSSRMPPRCASHSIPWMTRLRTQLKALGSVA